MDLLYSLLKVTSMIATGAFGALGLLTKYKDDQGKITKWGKVALGGILISSGISLGLYILETSKAKAAAVKAQAEAKATAEKLETILFNARTTAEQQKKNLDETSLLKAGLEKTLEQQGLNLERSDYIAKGMENSLAAQQLVLSGNKRILGGVTNTVKKQGELLTLNTSTLNEINRGLYPIKNVSIGYWIRVPMDHVQLKNYINRFDRDLTSLLPQLNLDSRPPWFKGGVMEAGSSTIRQFSFSADSPLAPDKTNEELAYTILGYSEIELQFFKNPIDPDEHPQISGSLMNNIKPDLRLGVTGGLSSSGLSGEHTIEYDLKLKQFRLRGFKLSSDPQYWESTGKIVGIPDLLGAQMFVHLRSVMISGNMATDKYVPEIRSSFELEALTISLTDGREFWFRGQNLRKHVDRRGLPVYSLILPKTLDELRKLER